MFSIFEYNNNSSFILFSLQTIQHKMAELKTSIAVCRSFIDECIAQHNIGCLDNSTASMAKVDFTLRIFLINISIIFISCELSFIFIIMYSLFL